MKIQLKRSSVLNGSSAKEPTADQMEYGELAVNYNTSDPVIFIKDSNDKIIRLASTSPDVIVQATAPATAEYLEGQLWWNSDSTSGKLFVLYKDPAGGGLEDDAGGLKWIETSPTPEIPSIFPDLDNDENQSGTTDDRYLRIDPLPAGANNQVVQSTGTTTFDGLIEAGEGVEVTGGDFADRKIVLFKPGEASGGIVINGTNRLFVGNPGKEYGLGVAADNLAKDNFASAIRALFYSTNHDEGVAAFRGSFEVDTKSSNSAVFAAETSEVQSSGNLYGFSSSIETSDAPNAYNFYASKDAPNFFAGDTYIGGSTSTTTRQLWESTLTEEEKEQLAAGTLAIPANVSTPGDGEFARQWWYDQQSAEDQSLIDAGELDYPEQFAAATFTDTFDLGVTTAINLLSTGTVECKGLEINGGTLPDTGLTLFGTAKNRLIVRSGGKSAAQFGDTGELIVGFDGIETDTNSIQIRMNGAGPNKGALEDDNAYIAWLPRNTAGTLIEAARFGPVLEGNAGNTNNIGCKFSFQLNSGSVLQEKAYINSSGMGSFEGGVKVTGASDSSNLGLVGKSLNFKNTEAGSDVTGVGAVSMSFGGTVSQSANTAVGIRSQFQFSGDYTKVAQFFARPSSSYLDSGSAGEAIGFLADSNISVENATTAMGFKSSIVGDDNYNFYAAGTAPNYFAGQVILGTSAKAAIDAGNYVTSAPLKLSPTGSNIPNGAAIEVYAPSASARQIAVFRNVDGQAGGIRISGPTTFFDESSDYRLKENVIELPNAISKLKQLKPYQFNFKSTPGETKDGFFAHELQELYPSIASGSKDATEAIGTLADYDGTIVKTDVTEPEELEYTEDVETEGVTTQVVRTRTWTPTGTRPVYQGVDQTKLIPLLTKALQEALDKIEVLEQRLSDAGIA